jgi:serine/threonine protein phosphatase PrpC
MSFSSNYILKNLDKQIFKDKNKLKKMIPTKPGYPMPSSTYNYIKEKEQFMKKETLNKFNNHLSNQNSKEPLKKRNIKCKEKALRNHTLNNSIKNVHIAIKNSNKNDYKINDNGQNDNININNLLEKNKSKTNSIICPAKINEENKENLKNKYNTNMNMNMNNSNIKYDKTIYVNKANINTKDNKINNIIYKKINLKSRKKKRTLSSNMNAIIKQISNESNTLKKSIISDKKNNTLTNDLLINHKKNKSSIRNLIEKNDSLNKISHGKIRPSKSFCKSVDKRNICLKRLATNRVFNKSDLNNDNIKLIFNNTSNQFYSKLKQIIPYSCHNSKIENNKIKYSLKKENSLNKSFTTNNFVKKFNLTQNDKFFKKEESNKKYLIECPEKNQKNNEFLYTQSNNSIIFNNYNNYRKKFKTSSNTNLSDLGYQLLNKSRDSVLSNKNGSVFEEPKMKVFKKILKIDSCTIPGYTVNGIKQKNQDSFFLKKNFLSVNEQFFIGICDGHGLFGDLVSQYISETLPLCVKNVTNDDLINAFIETNDLLLNKTKIDCSLSGATCTSLIITLDKIICANIGNTRAILARFENGCYNTVNLSRDHKPTESDEIKRIISGGGVIKQLYDKTKKEYIGPERVWLKNSDIPGLNMSRSFGDNLAHSVGVINIPEIRTFDYTGGEKFIIIASDSIWQYIDSDECVRIIKDYYEKNMDAVGALNSLVTEAITRWKKQENKIEDITAVVIFFE